MVAVIGVSISAATLLGTLIGFCIHNATSQGKNENRLDSLEKQFKEKCDHDREKFAQIYKQANEQSTVIATMSVNIVQIMNDIKDIKSELKGDR